MRLQFNGLYLVIIEDKIVILREELSNIEKSYEWKFLNNPEKYPCTYQWKFYSSELNITATLKLNTKQDRDRILSNNFSGKIPGIPRVDFFNVEPFYKAVNQRAEIEARNHLLAFKARHQNTLNEIQSNINELNKLRIARSSVLVIPTPSVPTLSYRAGSNSQVTQAENSGLAKGIENTVGNIRDGLAETFDCSFGMSCSNDLDKAAKNPNVGKELTAEEKEALGISSGGSATGTPNGFEPDDEEHKYNQQQQQNESKFKNFSEEDLISSANKPINKQGLSTAARAWDKHAARPDGVFEPLKGNPAQKNAASENFIREILKDPKVVRKDLSGGAFEYRLPSGKGIRYNADGSFNTVLDPTKVKK
ncbi:Contact-dependent inhibition of growth factor CdiA [Providencia vermicola]|uniref:Contact-dependent inhibition of growth factor CdiA n=1 Tax=Providencia vermicola TaxID=333965 RepID=UPI0034E4D8DF